MDDDCGKDAAGSAAVTVSGTGAAVWNVKSVYCRCSSFTLACRFSAVPIQLKGSDGIAPVVGDGNRLGVRSIGESRKPENALRKADGDAGGCDSGRDGGGMALNLDSPLSAPPLEAGPPRKLEKELVAKESATGPEFASVRKLPGVEVIGGRGSGFARRLCGEKRQGREAKSSRLNMSVPFSQSSRRAAKRTLNGKNE